MSITIDPAKVEVPQDTTDDMMHMADLRRPGYTLCGRKWEVFKGFDLPVDCIVCEDIRQARFGGK